MRTPRAIARCAALAGLALLVAGAPPARAQDGCTAALARFNEAVRAPDLAPIVALARAIAEDPQCPGELRNRVGRSAALAHLREARRLAAAGAPAADQLRVLEAGSRVGMPWQVLAALGDVLQDVPADGGAPDFAAASDAYQAALNDISDEAVVPEPPSEAVIRSLLRKAEQTRLLADRVVESPARRDGTPGGLAMRRVRGVVVARVALPIHFVRDSTAMTPLGARAAEQLSATLALQGMPPIRLVGHTDPDGSDAYNLDLSRRRAEALAAFLVARGYDPARIVPEGHGKREPLAIEARERYSQAQVYQMLRRVELVQ